MDSLSRWIATELRLTPKHGGFWVVGAIIEDYQALAKARPASARKWLKAEVSRLRPKP